MICWFRTRDKIIVQKLINIHLCVINRDKVIKFVCLQKVSVCVYCIRIYNEKWEDEKDRSHMAFAVFTITATKTPIVS